MLLDEGQAIWSSKLLNITGLEFRNTFGVELVAGRASDWDSREGKKSLILGCECAGLQLAEVRAAVLGLCWLSSWGDVAAEMLLPRRALGWCQAAKCVPAAGAGTL